MLYVIAAPHPTSSWSLGAKLYLRSLALASARANMPFRLLWSAVCSSKQLEDGGIVQSFGDMLDPSTFPPSLQALRSHFGPGSPPQTPSCMLFVGEVVTAVERIAHPDECPAKNVVLTSWPAATLPPHLAVRLGAYDLVLVPEGEGQIFADADVSHVVEVPWPAPTVEEVAAVSAACSQRPSRKPPEDVERLLCAAGHWQGEDGLERIADAFVTGVKRSDGIGLVLACNDVPRQWVKNVAIKHDRKTLPFIHVDTAFGLHDDPAAADQTLGMAHAFLDTSRRTGPSFWRQRAASLGCPIVNAFSASTTGYTGGALWPGVPAGLSWRDVLPILDVTKMLHEPSRAVKSGKVETDPAAAGVLIAKLISQVTAGTPIEAARVTVPSPAAKPRAAPPPAQDGIGVVVPFGGADLGGLHRCLVALKDARRPQDVIVVAIRGETVAARQVCAALGVACVESTSGGTRWNMSAVRNAGWCWLKDNTSCGFVAFVDADVVVPADYLKRFAREAYKRPGMVLTPYVVDEGAPDTEKTARIASGMSMFPLEALVEARGFDEAYVGWGHEDIDLLHRLREMYGVPAVALPNAAPGVHTPHEAREGSSQKQADHEANIARYEAAAQKLDAGEKIEVNEGSDWGWHLVLYTPGA
jgi:hypothetical protein